MPLTTRQYAEQYEADQKYQKARHVPFSNYELLLLQLLARIHRDGGQHTAKVGIEQSCKDADLILQRPQAGNVSPITNSDRIELLSEWIALTFGYTVETDHSLPVAGRIYYPHEGHRIVLNEPTARGALLTLAHEVGHAIGHSRRPSCVNRERQAFCYGYIVLHRLFPGEVSWFEWKLHHSIILQ
jgi:hypothetical protein